MRELDQLGLGTGYTRGDLEDGLFSAWKCSTPCAVKKNVYLFGGQGQNNSCKLTSIAGWIIQLYINFDGILPGKMEILPW